MRRLERNDWFAVLAVFAGYVGLAAWLPPLDDELYYWCWAKQLQWSYYDHPAMTAVMIRAGVELLGDTVLAIRLPACAAMAGVFGVLLSLTRPKAVLWAALTTPPFTFGAVLMTPDVPLLLFWALYLKWLVGVHERLSWGDKALARSLRDHPLPRKPFSPRTGGEGWQEDGTASVPESSLPSPPVTFGDGFRGRGVGGEGRTTSAAWLLGGLLLGLGVLGKYTMALAGGSAFASFLLLGRHRVRAWLPGFVLHGVVAVAVACPILIHNLRHDFEPLRYQWQHAMSDDEPGLGPFAEFVAVQVVLLGTLPLVLLWWTFRYWRELTADPRLRACACLFALPLAFFLLKSTRGVMQGNWALAAYLGFWPLAGEWWVRCGDSALWRWLTRTAFALPALCVLAVFAHLVYPLPFFPVKHDRVRRPAERVEQYRRVAEAVRNRPGPVFVPTYQLAAGLRFFGVDARQLDGVSRPSHFTQTPDDPARYPTWFWFGDFPLPDEFARRLPPPTGRQDIPLTVRGEVYDEYTLWEYFSPPP